MESNTKLWLLLIMFLSLTTFGVYWITVTLTGLLMFFVGFLTVLYLKQGDLQHFDDKNSPNNPLDNGECIYLDGGLKPIVSQLLSPMKVQKTDNRVTGSELIDSSLQEILGYIIRDYIRPWYGLISRDKEFTDVTVRKTAQTLAINISNRVKEVDWIPYLTTRLVDDAATHLRLFKQSRAKMKYLDKNIKSPRNSPLRDKSSPKKTTHKRNKSETDINWYYGKNYDSKRDIERTAGNSKFYGSEKKIYSLEEHFFDLECQLEQNQICRDMICTNDSDEKEFLCELVEILLYILLPDEDFQCKPLRYLLRELFVNCVLLPVFNMLSNPDYINKAIIWLCLQDSQLPSEIFLTTLRLTDNCDELKSTKDLVLKEIQILRSRDSGGESDLSIKQQLSSLSYVLKLIDNRLSKMENADSLSMDYIQMENIKKIHLTLDQILKNNVALSYFIDFISNQGKQVDLFFYLNVEGWRISVEQQLSEIHLNRMKESAENVAAVYNTIRSTASSIYDQYLGEKCDEKVQVNASVQQRLEFKIRNLSETPTELWFDEVQKVVYDKMESDGSFLPAFLKSKAYIKLLHELDLVQQPVTEEDNISVNSGEGIENSNEQRHDPLMNKMNENLLHIQEKNVKHARSFSDVTMLAVKSEMDLMSSQETIAVEEKIDDGKLRTGDFVLAVNIIETGIVCEKGKTFGIYAIRVTRQYDSGFLEEWHIYRRYSDFYDLHTKIKDKFPDLSKIPFPGKKTFHNMDRSVLERRMKMLGSYMNEVCQTDVLNTHHSLRGLLMTFLEQGEYDRATGGPISSTINTLVNPIKSGMKTIKNMPEQLINTVDEVVEGISKVFHGKPGRLPETSKVGASIEGTDDNIPFRIMLLLMDEVFDLKSRNQWLRRRIVTILRQIVRAIFGDSINRKILDYVSYITSPKNVAHYLYVFKQSFWPNGMRYQKKSERDVDTQNRTRVAAKVALLSCLSDELKHIIGSETTRRGLLTIFELFQRPILNRRLLYVLLEGILRNLFPDKDMVKIFLQLYAKSKRIQAKTNVR